MELKNRLDLLNSQSWDIVVLLFCARLPFEAMIRYTWSRLSTFLTVAYAVYQSRESRSLAEAKLSNLLSFASFNFP